MRPHISRRYCWVADILTLFRGLAAVAIAGCAFLDAWSVEAVLVVFVLGELSDGLDGWWARTFIHPRAVRDLWFRRHAPMLDKITDILLAVATLLYVIMRVDRAYGLSILALGLVIAVPIELLKGRIEDCYGEGARKLIILLRRGLYVVAIFLTANWMFAQTWWFKAIPTAFWWEVVKFTMPLMGVLVVAIFKPDRASEEDTVTPRVVGRKLKTPKRTQRPKRSVG